MKAEFNNFTSTLDNSIKLDLMGVKKGLYLVKLTTNDLEILTQRLIVE